MTRTARHATTRRFPVLATLLALLATVAGMPTTAHGSELEGRRLLDATLDAHGGLAAWREQARFEYAIPDFPLGPKAPLAFHHTADLHQRRHLMVGSDYRLGFDGRDGWAVGGKNAGLPARFVTVGNSYFVMMPFVFADPGSSVRSLGRRELDGRTYDLVAVSYASGTGDSAEDDYVLYLDAETKRLRLIHFAVTYLALRGDTPVAELPRKALVFDDWQEVDGLLVPARATFHAWDGERPTGDAAGFAIEEVRFGKDAPDTAQFRAPAEAEIDRSHVG